MTPRMILAAVLAALLLAATRVRVSIWLAGHLIARPPLAGLLLVALLLAAAGLGMLAWRMCRGFRSHPYPRTA